MGIRLERFSKTLFSNSRAPNPLVSIVQLPQAKNGVAAEKSGFICNQFAENHIPYRLFQLVELHRLISWSATCCCTQCRWLKSKQWCSWKRVSLGRVNQRLQVTAAGKEVSGSLMKGAGLRFGVVVGRFNEIITRPLLAGALETFTRYQVREEDIDVRGATTHYDAVANSAASGIMSASLNSNVPCIFGVLTTENMEQAIDRAGGKAGNKGAEAAITALEMASLFQHTLNGRLNSEA